MDRALGYLIGEKLVNFIRAADSEPKFAAELPSFVAEIRDTFEPHELADYIDTVKRFDTPILMIRSTWFADPTSCRLMRR